MPDKISLGVLRFLAQKHAIPEHIVSAVLTRMLPSVRLVPTVGPARVGGCRVGGSPDLPAGVPWPRLSEAWGDGPEFFEEEGMANTPLPFLLQVNLAETARFAAAAELPKHGMLYFFWLFEDWDEQTAYILHTNEEPLTAPAVPGDLVREQLYRGVALTPQHEWTIDSIENTVAEGTDLMPLYRFFEEAESHLAQAHGLTPPNSRSPCHRLLGHPRLIQSPGLGEATRLLLQIDSDQFQQAGDTIPRTGMLFGDCGRVYFLIDDEQIRTGDLARKPWALWETC